jgi:hypothetical protein
MRVLPFAVLVGLALTPLPGFAEDTAAGSAVPTDAPKVMLSTSISMNLPLTASDSAARQAKEDSTRKDLYLRSARECELLLDSIAASCVITSVNLSSQVNSSPGQPDYLYTSSTITMEVGLK